DETTLDEDEKRSQAASRRANIFALLATALFLFADVLFLGWMSATESGTWLAFFLVMFAVTTVVKLWLSGKAIGEGRAAVSLTRQLAKGSSAPMPYLSNANGAVWGGSIMLLVSVVLAGFAGQKAASTDWSCAFSDNAVQCLQ